MMQRLQLFLHLAELIEHGHGLGKHRAPGEREPVLWKIANGHALGHAERSVVERLHSAENLEQCGFAGAIAADQPRALTRRNQPVAVFKQELVAETFPGPLELNHFAEKSYATLGPKIRGFQ